MAPLGRRGFLRKSLVRFKSRRRPDDQPSTVDESIATAAEGPKDIVIENPLTVWLEGNANEHLSRRFLIFSTDEFIAQRIFLSSNSIYHGNPGSTTMRRQIMFIDIVGIIYLGMTEEEKLLMFRDRNVYSREFLEADQDMVQPLCLAICTSHCGFHRGGQFTFKLSRSINIIARNTRTDSVA
jgi:hypothetical protein